jgi:hypothetical protein
MECRLEIDSGGRHADVRHQDLHRVVCRRAAPQGALREEAPAGDAKARDRQRARRLRPAEAAARLAGMSDQALSDSIKRCNEKGLAGLYDRAKAGRPRKLNAAQEAELPQDILVGSEPEIDGISAYTLEDLRRVPRRAGASAITAPR